jgi:predicted transcriptional regulator
MIVTALILIFLFDVALLFAFLYLNKNQGVSSDLLLEITDERRKISELTETLRNEIQQNQIRSKENLNKVAHLAAEAEQEVKNSGETLAKNMQDLIQEFTTNCELPLNELAKRHASLESIYKKIEREKNNLAKLISRSENLVRFFQDHLPYEEVIKDIEIKKYADARQLLTQGMTPEKVASELGLSSSVVQMMRGLT